MGFGMLASKSGSFVLTKVQFHHLLRTQGGERISLTTIVAKLDFKHTILPLLDNRTHFATAQAFGNPDLL